MDAQVVLQVIVVDKLGVAVEADVRALASVFPHVDLEFVLSGESHFADSAHVRFLPSVCPHVPGQFSSSLNDFVADGALLRCLWFDLPLLLQLPGWKQRSQVGGRIEEV